MEEVVVKVGRDATREKGVCDYGGKSLFFPPSLLSTAGSYALGNFCSPQKCLRHPVCAGKCPKECVRIKGRTHILGNTPSQYVLSPTTARKEPE